jgi:hypothetical protein
MLTSKKINKGGAVLGRTSDCQVTLGAGWLAMVGKEKMAAWPAFTSRLSLAISEKVVMSKHILILSIARQKTQINFS